MPPESDGFDVAAFLAENPVSEADPDPAPKGEPGDPAEDDGPETDEQKAALAALEGDEPSDDDSDDEPADDDAEPAAESLAVDVKALAAALKSKNPEAFLEALGDAAADVLGANAHKALRLTAKEVKSARTDLLSASAQLKEKFGEPAAIRAAAARGDADAAVEGIERFFGVPWADVVKFVNASFAGKPARLEAKAQAARAETEAKTAKQTAAVTTLKTSIADTVKKTQPALVGLPNVTELVFEKLKTNYSKGINTPSKALAAVLVDLRATHAALSKAFAAPERKPIRTAPPPRESGRRGREMTEDEFMRDFLAHNKP